MFGSSITAVHSSRSIFHAGFCVADPSTIVAFQEVFVSLRLPYSVRKHEQISISPVIYNYGASSRQVDTTLPNLSHGLYNTNSMSVMFTFCLDTFVYSWRFTWNKLRDFVPPAQPPLRPLLTLLWSRCLPSWSLSPLSPW